MNLIERDKEINELNGMIRKVLKEIARKAKEGDCYTSLLESVEEYGNYMQELSHIELN